MRNLRRGSRTVLIGSLMASLILAGCPPGDADTALPASIPSAPTVPVPTAGTPLSPTSPPRFVVVPYGAPLYDIATYGSTLAAGTPRLFGSAYPGQRFEVRSHFRDKRGKRWFQVEVVGGPGWYHVVWLEADRTLVTSSSAPQPRPAPQFVVVPAGGPLYVTPGPGHDTGDWHISAYPGQRFEVRERSRDETGQLWFQVDVAVDVDWTDQRWLEATRTVDADYVYGAHIPTVQGGFGPGGQFRLQRTGPTVTARITVPPAPAALDTYLFTVPPGWRPAQTVTWSGDSGRRALHIAPNGTVSYRDTASPKGGATGPFTAALAWPGPGTSPAVCARPPGVQQALLAALQAQVGQVLPCEAVTWDHLARIREMDAVIVGHPSQLAGLTGLRRAELHFGSGVGFPEILAQIPQVRELHLGLPDATSLPPDLLAALPQLRQLKVGSRSLRSLPSGLLAPVPQLETLILQGYFPGLEGYFSHFRMFTLFGMFDQLPADLLVPAPQLTHLEIASARIARLPEGFLAASPHLQSLLLHIPSLDQVPADFLTPLPQLTTLQLRSHQALPLAPGLLGPVPRLHTLDLQTLSAHPLAADFLAPVPRLRSLRLWHGQPTSLPADFLAPVTRLRKLELLTSLEQVTHLGDPMQAAMELPPPAFWAQVPALTTLTLWPGPTVLALPPDFLAPLSHLKTLRLRTSHTERDWGPKFSRTQPLGLPAGLWVQAPQLQVVSLHGDFRPEDHPASRRILRVSQEIRPEVLQEQAEAVTHLTLTGSEWSRLVPRDLLAYFPQVTHLALSPGLLGDMPRDFLAQVPRLAHLTLRIDGPTDLPFDLLAHASTLTHLSLQVDGLTALPPDFRLPVPDLTHLTLHADALETLPDTFLDGNPALSHLTLHADALETLPDTFLDGNPALSHLTLETNALPSLPATFLQSSPKLTHLLLQADGLRALPDAFLADTAALTHLTLQAEGLRALPPHFLAHPAALTHLSLQGNQLESLPDDFLQEVPNLARLVLQVYGIKAPPPGFRERLAAVPNLVLQFRPPIPEPEGLG